jgi:hypothetical protein
LFEQFGKFLHGTRVDILEFPPNTHLEPGELFGVVVEILPDLVLLLLELENLD